MCNPSGLKCVIRTSYVNIEMYAAFEDIQHAQSSIDKNIRSVVVGGPVVVISVEGSNADKYEWLRLYIYVDI